MTTKKLFEPASETLLADKVGQKLTLLRARTGLSLKKFCALAGVSVRRYEDWEKGRALPNGQNALKLANAHRMEVSELYR